MMQGDSYKLPIQINTAEGALVPDMIEDIEVFVGQIRKTYRNGEITYDEEQTAFLVDLSQKETFRLRGKEKVQARVKFTEDDVVGVDLGELDIANATSKVVL